MQISKSFDFCFGHRLLFHNGKCFFPHGHNGKIILTFSGNVNEHGMVVDFGVVKEKFGVWLNLNWDHAWILNKKDADMRLFFQKKRFRVYELLCEPTAENLASHLAFVILPKLFDSFSAILTQVDFYETSTSCASLRV